MVSDIASVWGLPEGFYNLLFGRLYKRGNVYTSRIESPRDGRELFQGLVVGESIYIAESATPTVIFKSVSPKHTHTHTHTFMYKLL